VKLARLVFSQSCSVFTGWSPQVAIIWVHVVLQHGHFALRFHTYRTCEIALGHRGGNLCEGAHLSGEVGRQLIYVIRENPSRFRRLLAPVAWPPSLPSTPTSRAHVVYLIGKVARVSIHPLMYRPGAISPRLPTSF